ncbi:MAG: protein translocase subunit SecF [Methanocalculaceae archaeon]|jgi:preprotein translocase subunit SecF|nr:protein translocase subunit SecF [Methanocalculaceae archaeon]
MQFPRYDINKYDPKRMMLIPLLIFLVAAAIVGFTFASIGMPVTPGIDFVGGTAVTIHTTDTKEQITAFFADCALISIDEGVGTAGDYSSYYLTFESISNDEELKRFNNKTLGKYPDARIDHTGANFGATLQSKAMIALLFAFISMALVVFIAFRKLIPAATVVFAGIADITITAGTMNLLGIELSLATTAALLMLIGYSVDSNILLTSKILKQQGKLVDKMAGAFHTGFIMTTTTLSAIVVMLIVAVVGQVPTLSSIAAVLVIGLICDMILTWAFNAGALRLYLESEEGKKQPSHARQKIKRAKGVKS